MTYRSPLAHLVVILALSGCGDDGGSSDTGMAGDSRAPDGDTGRPMDSSGPDSAPRPDTGPRPDGALPEGDEGIAAGYPGDDGIGAAPGVVFADDFESYSDASGLSSRWDHVYHEVRIATETENVRFGSQALELTIPTTGDEISNTVAKDLMEELDVIFLRYYSRFDSAFDITGSSHNGGGVSAHYYEDGRATPGVPADGMNKFLVALENWRGEASTPSPGHLNLYLYHPEQRSMWGDHLFPTGTVLPNSSMPGDFGDDFVSRPDVLTELGRWYCYELMVAANTPGERDGRLAIWVDGALVADFPNVRLRDVASLTIDRFNLSFHAGSNSAGPTSKGFDNVVVATSYIGPVFE